MASLTWLEDGVPKVARLEPGTAYVLGREESVDIPVASPAKTISRRHARISVRGATCSIENLSETNVTKLNGAPISGTTVLSDHDLVELGTTSIQFHDLKSAVILSGLICDHCKRENPANRKDCWYCGQNLVNAQSIALRNRHAACRIVSTSGPATDVFIGRGAGIRGDGAIEAARSGQSYALQFEAFGDNLASMMTADGVTNALHEPMPVEVAGRSYLVLLP